MIPSILANAAGFDWRHAGRRLIVSAAIDGAPMTPTIAVRTTRPHFGGVRLWFVCLKRAAYRFQRRDDKGVAIARGVALGETNIASACISELIV